eukprot:5914838-Pyramimonas_sp.AAC.1
MSNCGPPDPRRGRGVCLFPAGRLPKDCRQAPPGAASAFSVPHARIGPHAASPAQRIPGPSGPCSAYDLLKDCQQSQCGTTPIAPPQKKVPNDGPSTAPRGPEGAPREPKRPPNRPSIGPRR